MGRRARTNCSPVDSMLEKYHNDIGNRLSGVFMPPATNTDTTATTTTSNTDTIGQNLAEDFCMLTLDMRRANSLKTDMRPKGYNTESSATQMDAAMQRSTLPLTGATSSPYDCLDHENGKAKTRLVDKLTRALFQKKHMCARCKRKSRSCMLNKTFSVTEKRYTCGRCRENSSALKNFFDGHSNSSNSPLSSSSSPATSKRGDGTTVPQPRTLNDSGYETVTSCSTVASSYSAFSKNIPNMDISTRSQDMLGSDSLCHGNSALAAECNHHHHGEPTCPLATMNACPEQQPSVPRRLPAAHEYDGYLPDFIEFRGWARQNLRRCSHEELSNAVAALGEEASANGVEDDEEDECGGGVICVRRPTSLDSSSSQTKEKACHLCSSTSVPCFRLPWEGGWVCEDCMDGIY